MMTSPKRPVEVRHGVLHRRDEDLGSVDDDGVDVLAAVVDRLLHRADRIHRLVADVERVGARQLGRRDRAARPEPRDARLGDHGHDRLGEERERADDRHHVLLDRLPGTRRRHGRVELLVADGDLERPAGDPTASVDVVGIHIGGVGDVLVGRPGGVERRHGHHLDRITARFVARFGGGVGGAAPSSGDQPDDGEQRQLAPPRTPMWNRTQIARRGHHLPPVAIWRAQDAHRPATSTIEHTIGRRSPERRVRRSRRRDAVPSGRVDPLMVRDAKWGAATGDDERGHQIRVAGSGRRRVVRLCLPGPDRDLPRHRDPELCARRNGDRRRLHAVGAARERLAVLGVGDRGRCLVGLPRGGSPTG